MTYIDTIKAHSVVVDEGSGVLMQGLTDQYSYILTAKHVLLIDRLKPQGSFKEVSDIKITTFNGETLNALQIFPHSKLDIAIVTIDSWPVISIYPYQNQVTRGSEVLLYGYPNYSDEHRNPEYKLNDWIETYGLSVVDISTHQLELTNHENVQLSDLGGFSGGGLFYIEQEQAYLIGIEHSVARPAEYIDRIVGAPIIAFNEILNANHLAPIQHGEPPNSNKIAPMRGSLLFPDYTVRVQRFVDDYIGTAKHPVPFGGRKADLAYLDAWLKDETKSTRLFLGAPAGRGKSALLIHWSIALASQPNLHIIFFPISVRFETNRASVVFPALAAQFALMHGEELPDIIDTEVWRALVASYIARPMSDGMQLLLIIDGIDEAADWEVGPDLFPYILPTSTHVVVSGRYLTGDIEGSAWLERLGWSQPGQAMAFSLNLLSQSDVKDILNNNIAFPHYLASSVNVVEELYRLSEGDPILIRLYVEVLRPRGDEAEEGREDQTVLFNPEALIEIDSGFEGFFDRWWKEQRKLWDNKAPLKEPLVQALFNIFSCALGPIMRNDLFSLAAQTIELNIWTFEEAMQPLNRFIIGDGKSQGYAFTHPRFAYYFYDKLQEVGQAKKQELLFVDWGRKALVPSAGVDRCDISSYLIQYYRIHLERTQCELDDLKHLLHRTWMKAWKGFDKGGYFGFLTDVQQVWIHSRKVNENAISTANSASALGIELRCCLYQSSVSSLAGKIPINIVIGLLKNKAWSISQALAYCTQILDIRLRLETLLAIGKSLSVQHQPMLTSKFLSAIHSAENDTKKVDLLLTLSKQGLPAYIYLALLDDIRDIDDNAKKIRLLIKASNAFSGDLLHNTLYNEALSVYQDLDYSAYKANLILPSIHKLEGGIKRKAIVLVVSEVCAISDFGECRRILDKLWYYLDEPLRALVFKSINELLDDIHNLEERKFAESYLTPYLQFIISQKKLPSKVVKSGDLQSEVIHVKEVPENLEPVLADFDKLLKLALDALSDNKKEEFHTTQTATCGIENAKPQVQELQSLAPQLSKELLHIFFARLNSPEYFSSLHRVRVLVSQLPDSLISQLAIELRNIKDPVVRAEVLVTISKSHPAQNHLATFGSALKSLGEIKEKLSQFRAAKIIFQNLPDALVLEGLNTLWLLGQFRASFIAGQIPFKYKSQAMEFARSMDDPGDRLAIMLRCSYPKQPLSSAIADISNDIIAVARQQQNEEKVADVMEIIVCYQTEEQFDKVRELAITLKNAYQRARILIALAVCSTGSRKNLRIEEALLAARKIEDAMARANLCYEFTWLLPTNYNFPVFSEAVSALISVISKKQSEEFTFNSLQHWELSLALPRPLMVAALLRMLSSGALVDPENRAETFLFISSTLPQPLAEATARRAVGSAMLIVAPLKRVEVLCKLAS